jgi:hypothetical protein
MKRKGGWRTIQLRRYMRIRLGSRKRIVVPLTGVRTDAEADARCALIANVGERLIAAGRADQAERFARELGEATTAKRVETVRNAVAKFIATASAPVHAVTFGGWAMRWTSGDLARSFPDYVKAKDAEDDVGKLKTYILPHVADVPLARFGLEDAERVMAEIPPERSPATRRHVAQVMHRLLAIAVYPGKILAANPLPKGFLPKLKAGKAKPYLYPDEDAALMACTKIPLERRLTWGTLGREGMRAGELVGNEKQKRAPMAWPNADFRRGVFTLDKNKTDDARTWAMNPGVARALKKWRALRPRAVAIFSTLPKLAEQLRDDLVLALGDHMRPELLERSASRSRLVAHHLRATFVTLSLANGKTETWVQDRTGHRSTAMINGYRRAARTAAELGLGELIPLDQAIPEFRRAGRRDAMTPRGSGGAKVGQKGARMGSKKRRTR